MNEPNRAMSTVMGKQWVEEQTQRQMRLERLYILDGRHRATLSDGSPNPYHGVYTGLAEKAEELERELDE